jgi:hypothetical protein
MAALMCAGALLLGVVLAGARSTNDIRTLSPPETDANSSEKPAGENSEKSPRFRESDELVDQAGQFSMSGDRMVFVTAQGQQQFIALENLPLQQVAKTIDGKSAPLKWIVSGKVTEYRGSNFLLLTHAQNITETQAVSKP